MDGVAGTFSTYRFVLSLALVVGGIVAIWCGYRLFATGAGTARAIDKFDFKNNEVKISAAGMSVGAVLMLTSSVWSYFAYSSFPKLEASRDTIKIGGIPIPDATIGRIVGAPVYAAGKEKVGSISHVLVNDKAQATGIVVQTDQDGQIKQVIVSPDGFEFDKSGSGLRATVKMNRGQFDNLIANAPPGPRG